MFGYRAYDGSFLEFAYGLETAPWATPDGLGAITLGGMRFYEHRGSMINTLTAVLAAAGAAGRPLTPTYTDASGRVYVNKDADDRAHEEYNRKVFEGAATRPFSLELRGYHDSMGSDMDGVSMALQRTSVRAGGDGMSGWGVVGGRLETNRNYAPSTMDAPAAFTRWWAGITYEQRRALVRRGPLIVGLHGHALLALGNPWLALVSVGPEVMVTDRLHVRVAATSELHRFDASAGIGWRGELGVRF